MFGFTPWMLIGFAITLAVTNGTTAITAYKFGADRQRVLCQVRVDKINEKIIAANLEIKKQADEYDRKIAELETEGEAETRRADEAEALNNVALGEFADEVAKRADRCPISADDARRLR